MTQKSNNIPVRYKDSPLGIIPQEWEVKRLGDIAQSFSGGTPKAGHKEYYGGEIPFIRSGEIHQINTALYLSRAGMETSSAKMVYKGDLLMALYGANSGDTAISQINGAINQAILCIRPQNMFVEFLQAILEHNKEIFIAKYLQGGQGNLSGEIVNNYYIPLPPLPEQEKIAEILSTWDKAIERQTQLIQKLELRKKGLMQQLLTGKKRLPGFTGEWEKVNYNNILREVHRSLKWDDSELYDLISVRRRSGGAFHRESLYGYEIKTKSLRPALKGDFLISKMQIVHGASGVVPEYLSGMKISGSYIALIAEDPKVLNINYFNLWSQMPLFYHQTFVSSYGVHIEKMTFDLDAFMSLSMNLPLIEEQNRIVEIISIFNNDIELAKEKLEQLRQQKRGLMQQLLTGKKRVI